MFRWKRFAVIVIWFVQTAPVFAQWATGNRHDLLPPIDRTASDTAQLSLVGRISAFWFFSTKGTPYRQRLDTLTLALMSSADTTIRAMGMHARGDYYFRMGYKAKFHRDMTQALVYFRKAEQVFIAGEQQHSLLFNHDGTGVLYRAVGLPHQAISACNEALALTMRPASGAPSTNTMVRIHLAGAYSDLGDGERALAQLAACDSMHPTDAAMVLLERGRIMEMQGARNKALRLMDKAVARSLSGSSQWDRIGLLSPAARLHLKNGDHAVALALAEECATLADHQGDEAAWCGCKALAGEARWRLGDVPGAVSDLRAVMDTAEMHGYIGISRETGDDGSMVRVAAILKEVYKAQGRTEDALAMTEKWAAWQDTLRTLEGREELLRYDIQQHELTDSIAEAKRLDEATRGYRETLQAERTRRYIELTVGLSALVIALLAAWFYFNRRKQEHKLAAIELQRTQQEHMIADLRMHERMSEDLHEDLGAGLSALKLWSEMDLADETDARRKQHLAKRSAMADELVASLRQIIWAMNSPATGVKQLVDYLVDYAHLHCAQHGLRLRAEAKGPWPDIKLSAEQRRYPFLAVKEVLANTVKHAEASRVNMRVTWNNGLVIELHDDGKGASSSIEALPGNGLRNLQRRIGSLGGEMTIDGSNGMRITVRVPLSPSA